MQMRANGVREHRRKVLRRGGTFDIHFQKTAHEKTGIEHARLFQKFYRLVLGPATLRRTLGGLPDEVPRLGLAQFRYGEGLQVVEMFDIEMMLPRETG